MQNEKLPNPYDKLDELEQSGLEVRTLPDLKNLIEEIGDFASEWSEDIDYPEAALSAFNIGLKAVVTVSRFDSSIKHEANFLGLAIHQKALKALPKNLSFQDVIGLIKLGKASFEFAQNLSEIINPMPSSVLPFYRTAVVSYLLADQVFYEGYDLINFIQSLNAYNSQVELRFKGFLNKKWEARLAEDKLSEMQKISTFYLDCIDKILLTLDTDNIAWDLANIDEVTSKNPDQYRNQLDLLVITISTLLSLSIEYLNQINLEERDLFYFEQTYELRESLKNIFANLDKLDVDQNVSDYYSYCLLAFQKLRFISLTESEELEIAKQTLLDEINIFHESQGYKDYRLEGLEEEITALK